MDSADGDDRVKEFLARHGGPGTQPPREGSSNEGTKGWSEVTAADGYCLRCDWSTMGDREEMQFSEIAPSDSPAVNPGRP